MGVKIGLVIGIYFVAMYLYFRYKKENLSGTFEECKDKKKVYVYWTRNSVASKRPIPIYFDGKEAGYCRKAKILELDRPSKNFEISTISEYNNNKVVVEDKELLYIIIDSAGRCERYTNG